MNAGIKSGFAQGNLSLPGIHAEVSNLQFGNLDWVIVRTTRKNATRTFSMSGDTSLQASDYLFNKVIKLSKHKNPIEGQGDQHVVLIGTWL